MRNKTRASIAILYDGYNYAPSYLENYSAHSLVGALQPTESAHQGVRHEEPGRVALVRTLYDVYIYCRMGNLVGRAGGCRTYDRMKRKLIYRAATLLQERSRRCKQVLVVRASKLETLDLIREEVYPPPSAFDYGPLELAMFGGTMGGG